MNLKEFNIQNTTPMRSGTPAIGVNQTTGLFNINQLACEKLKMKDNDQIVILQDEDQPENWYLEIVKENGFVARKKSNVTAGLLFNNSALARQIAAPSEIPGSYRILIAKEPTKFQKRTLWGLLLKANS